jgi:hypothetical protein
LVVMAPECAFKSFNYFYKNRRVFQGSQFLLVKKHLPLIQNLFLNLGSDISFTEFSCLYA